MTTRRDSSSSPDSRDSETGLLAAIIAREFWTLHEREGVLDWTGVEAHLGSLLRQTRRDARQRSHGASRLPHERQQPRRRFEGAD